MKDDPKRRKDKYNPYKLSYFKDEGKYIIQLKQNKTINYFIEVSKEIYSAFNSFELEDKSQMNKYERHIENSIITDITLYNVNVNIKMYKFLKIRMYKSVHFYFQLFPFFSFASINLSFNL